MHSTKVGVARATAASGVAEYVQFLSPIHEIWEVMFGVRHIEEEREQTEKNGGRNVGRVRWEGFARYAR